MARRGTGLHFSWVWKASETEVVTRGGKEGRERERDRERERERKSDWAEVGLQDELEILRVEL